MRRSAVLVIAALLAGSGLAGCGSAPRASSPAGGKISIVAAENQYGSVAAQIGGRYVQVTSIVSNPNTDPHTYEVSPSVARQIGQAQLIVENGLGYDDFISKIQAAAAGSGTRVVDAQRVLGLSNSTPNPHLWYDPRTMPAVARAIAADLAAVDPGHAAYYQSNVAAFDASLQPWLHAISAFKVDDPGTAAATTEPVADYLLTAMGIDNRTPFSFQADVMNGDDPAPQGISLEEDLLARHRVKLFVYNRQVVDTLTATIRSKARKAGIPVVGVYETMPAPGYVYQTWMLAETQAIQRAVTNGTSTEGL